MIPLVFRYLGRSRVERGANATAITFAPNLARPPVSFDAELADPLRFREAISALHGIVISDHRFQPRDRTAYREWLRRQSQEEQRVRIEARARAKQDLEARRGNMPPDLPRQFAHWHRLYWAARREYAGHLRRNDPALFRQLMPCDPVITVAPDVVFFECFSADESSYGCLTVERDAMFRGASSIQPGTTNVDYSWALYEHFQKLRTYRPTRFLVDPRGFEVHTASGGEIREEKIDLPESWLRGFLQIQAGMTLPARKVTIDRESLYSVLAFLRRHKAKRSPRAMRFDLVPGQSPALELQPWGQRVLSRSTRWDGAPVSIRIYGRQRLLVLGRLLPLIESVDVVLLGDGLPSFWIAKMGPMRLTLGLSGWTTNDWTRASAVDLLAPKAEVRADTVKAMAEALEARLRMKETEFGGSPEVVRGALYRLARLGQCIHDLHEDVVRWRRVMPPEIAVEKFIPENPEIVESRALQVRIDRNEQLPSGLRVLGGRAGTVDAEVLLDADWVFKRAKCSCSHFYKGGLKKGPCRHLLALRTAAMNS